MALCSIWALCTSTEIQMASVLAPDPCPITQLCTWTPGATEWQGPQLPAGTSPTALGAPSFALAALDHSQPSDTRCGSSWGQVLHTATLSSFARVALGLLENRQSPSSSETVWGVLQTLFFSYSWCLLWYLQSICHTQRGANCLAVCYDVLHFCLLLTFCITDLAADWLQFLLQKRNVKKCLENTLSMTYLHTISSGFCQYYLT